MNGAYNPDNPSLEENLLKRLRIIKKVRWLTLAQLGSSWKPPVGRKRVYDMMKKAKADGAPWREKRLFGYRRAILVSSDTPDPRKKVDGKVLRRRVEQ